MHDHADHLRRMTTRASWITNGARKIDQLTANYAELQARHAAALDLISALQLALGITPGIRPPHEFVNALRAGDEQAWVTIDGHDVVVGLRPVPRIADPVGEALAWQEHLAIHQRACDTWNVPVTFIRAVLPRGHRWQAWRRERSRSLAVVLNGALPHGVARASMRAAVSALRLNAIAVPLIMLLLG